MAKFKKAAKKTGTRRAARAPDAQQQAERLARTLSESAQQVWLAGVGAFGRAQAEGGKLFDALVKEGANLERNARQFAGGQAEVVKEAVESRVGEARERASDTWDRLEKVFEDRVQRALVKLGVPNRSDVAELNRRVESLTAELRRQGGPAAPRRAAAKKAAKKTVTRKAATRKVAKTTLPRKQAARKVAKTATVAKRTSRPLA